MTIVTLGPAGTFSHIAALKYANHKIIFGMNFDNIFEMLNQGMAELALLPIENSISGTVLEVLDNLIESKKIIIDETVLKIEHNLASFEKKDQVKKIYVHPHSHKQCQKYLKKYFPNVEIQFTHSNSESAERLLKNKEQSGAIISSFLAKQHMIHILQPHIQDSKNNKTRFILVGQKEAKPSKHSKTSLLVRPTTNRCGLLSEILSIFAKHKINLSKIESRPGKDKLGSYYFFMDFEAHKEDNLVEVALSELKKIAPYQFLGSYPQSQ